jgi:single-strand DNA-binding protein
MPAEAEAYNQVQLIGNLGADPDVKYFASGSVVTEVRIAVYTGKDKATGDPKPPMWITVKAWNQCADELAKLRKGDRLQVVRGQWSQDTWQDRATGANRTKDYCLAWEVAKIERQPKPQEQPQEPAANYEEIPF